MNGVTITTSKRKRIGSQPKGSTTKPAPIVAWIPNLILLFLVTFGVLTVILHHLASVTIANHSERTFHKHRSGGGSGSDKSSSSNRLPHGLGVFHPPTEPSSSSSSSIEIGALQHHQDAASESIIGSSDENLPKPHAEIDVDSPFKDQRTWYATLRHEFEAENSDIYAGSHDAQYERLLAHAKQLHGPRKFPPLKPVPYDIFDCPDEPPEEYPVQFPLMDILAQWNPDDVKLNSPDHPIHVGLCIFDYTKDGHYERTQTYRHLELPFVLRFHPEVLPTVHRWNTADYMKQMLQERHVPAQRTELSPNNHFMFWRLPPKRKEARRTSSDIDSTWQAPTENVELTYTEWLSHANITERTTPIKLKEKHYYYRLNGCPKEFLDDAEDYRQRVLRRKRPKHTPSERCNGLFLFDELPYFTPYSPSSQDHIVDPNGYRGINCRFGMEGAIAENHFDMSRNFITVLGGERRYILSSPDQCGNMALYPKNHPSGRHSIVDWSDVDSDPTWRTQFPEFYNQAMANEVVLQAGDTLYLPTNWMHYIISLNLNYQCNARSGRTVHYDQDVADCGFGGPLPPN